MAGSRCTIGASKSLFKASKNMQNSTGLITSARPDVFKLRNTCYQQLERGEKAKLPVREIVRFLPILAIFYGGADRIVHKSLGLYRKCSGIQNGIVCRTCSGVLSIERLEGSRWRLRRARPNLFLDAGSAGSSFTGVIHRFGAKVPSVGSSPGLAWKEIFLGVFPEPVFA
jgi:hypothetical protein